MSNSSYGEQFESHRQSAQRQTALTLEEQYVQCMDAAYASTDKETYLKMMQKAAGVLRGEFGPKQASYGSKEQAVAG